MPKSFAKIWRDWRLKKLLSQKQFARALGVTERTVQNIESGTSKPSLKSQRCFAALQARHEQAGRGSRAA